MPTKTTKPAAKASRKPKTQYAWRPTDIGQEIKENIKDRLKRQMNEFLENGRVEEITFMSEVFNDRENGGGCHPKGLGEYGVPLFSAIQTTIENGGRAVMLLPDDEMADKVNEFITELEKQAAVDRSVLKTEFKSPGYIRQMRQADLEHYMTRFGADATDEDLFFLESVMARWADVLTYKEEDQPDSPIMSALQYELDHQHWILKIPYQASGCKEIKTLVRLATADDWLGQLLTWIAEQVQKNGLTPCDLAKESFTYQREFDEKAKPTRAA